LQAGGRRFDPVQLHQSEDRKRKSDDRKAEWMRWGFAEFCLLIPEFWNLSVAMQAQQLAVRGADGDDQVLSCKCSLTIRKVRRSSGLMRVGWTKG
jgi:hypothetical protein